MTSVISNNIEMKINMPSYGELFYALRFKGVSEFRKSIEKIDIFSSLTKNELEDLLGCILTAKFSYHRNENVDDIIDMFLSHGITLTSFHHPYTMTMSDLLYLIDKGITTREKFDTLLKGCKCYWCAMTCDAELNQYIKFIPNH